MTYYDTIAPSYEYLHREEQLKKLRIIREHLALPQEAKILDVGCGPCWSAELFGNVTGVDPSAKLLRLARNNSRNRSMPTLIQARAEALPFAARMFDAVLCVTAIHHFDIGKALREMKRVLKPDGVLVVTVMKKATARKTIIGLLRASFSVVRVADAAHDTTFFLMVPKSPVTRPALLSEPRKHQHTHDPAQAPQAPSQHQD